MKLQFKEQGFQAKEVQAVANCFAGQALKTNRQLSPETEMKVV